MNTKQIIEHLTSLAYKKTVQQMKRFGINTEDAIGISVYQLRSYAKKLGRIVTLQHSFGKQKSMKHIF